MFAGPEKSSRGQQQQQQEPQQLSIGTNGTPAATAAPVTASSCGMRKSEATMREDQEEAHVAQVVVGKHEAKKRITELDEGVELSDTRQYPRANSYSYTIAKIDSFVGDMNHHDRTTGEASLDNLGSTAGERRQQQLSPCIVASPLPVDSQEEAHSLSVLQSVEDCASNSASASNYHTANSNAHGGTSASSLSQTTTRTQGSPLWGESNEVVGADSARSIQKGMSRCNGKGNASDLEHLSAWNEELVSTIEKLKRAMLKMDADAKARLILVDDELTRVRRDNEQLRQENTALKERVADDVLRQRQTNRSEMAMEKARIVARVRAAGQQRLEFMEGVVMESHDDLYYTQRWDAAVSPQRDVSFVFHIVSGSAFPLAGSEEFVFTVYQQVLYTTATQHGGYLAASFRGVEVFVFQDPVVALTFAKECHEQVAALSWPERTETLPYFSTIAEYGRVLFRGPRMHTCIYACTPEVEVDPVTGRSLFFGPVLRAGIEAALELSPVGEIVVNDTWAKLFCRVHRMRHDSDAPIKGDAADVRGALGEGWDVVGMPGTRGIVCSILPVTLQGRRGVQPNVLGPTPKYPRLTPNAPPAAARRRSSSSGAGPVSSMSYSPNSAVANALSATTSVMSVAKMTSALVDMLKGVGVDLDGNPVSSPSNGAAYSTSTNKRPHVHCGSEGGYAAFGATGVMLNGRKAGGGDAMSPSKDTAARMLELYSLKQEKENITALYRKVEDTCAALERNAMQAEDRFEITRHKLPDPSETAFVCTVDIGDDNTWRRILLAGMSTEEYEVLRSTLRSYVHVAAKHYYGFLMNGNYTDVFTYVFREVEQALAFVAEVYIQVNRAGTKYARDTRGTGWDVFLLRAGISAGPMSTIYRNTENGVLKCTGPVIRLSGTLCDLAKDGEILAMEDIISTFHDKSDNLFDTQYNIVKQKGQFLAGLDAPAVVHSILPKPFAYRRAALMSMAPRDKARALGSSRSAKAALMVQTRQYPRENVESFLTQQRERLEHSEAARMHTEDAYEREAELKSLQATLKNPWVVTTRANAEATQVQQAWIREEEERQRHPFGSLADEDHSGGRSGDDAAATAIPKLAFMYCDATGTAALKSELESAGAAPELADEVLSHFNYIVQHVLSEHGGFVARTNGKCAYVVLFDNPLHALEAGVLIQQRLLHAAWPVELKTTLPTLFVRDAATSTTLFSGLRAQIALHLSSDYTWTRLEPGGGRSTSTSTGRSAAAQKEAVGDVDVSGPAVEEVVVLGRHSRGGELRVSSTLLDAVGKSSLSGKLLIAQLAMEVVATPSSLSITGVGGTQGDGGRRTSTAGHGPSRLSSSSIAPAVDRGGSGGGQSEATARKSDKDKARSRGTSTTGHRGGSVTSLSSLSAASAKAAAGRSAAGSGGAARSASLAAPMNFRRTKPKPQEVFVCVAAVPRQLEGRLASLRCPTSVNSSGPTSTAVHSEDANPKNPGGDGAIRGEEDARHAQGHNKGEPDDSISASDSNNNDSSSSHTRGGNARSNSTAAGKQRASTSRRSVPSPPLALLQPISSQPLHGSSGSRSEAGHTQRAAAATSGSNPLNWCVEPSGAMASLPPAAKGPWEVAADRLCASGRKEAENIQHMAEQLLKLYDSVSFSAVASPMSNPLSPDASPPSATASRLSPPPAGGKKRPPPASPSPPPPPSPTPSTATKQPVDGSRKEATASPISSTLLGPAAKRKDEVSYTAFMRFSKEVLESCVAAMRVGNERARPPALPHLESGVLFTATGGSSKRTVLFPSAADQLDTSLPSGSPTMSSLPSIPPSRGEGGSRGSSSPTGKSPSGRNGGGASPAVSLLPRPPSTNDGAPPRASGGRRAVESVGGNGRKGDGKAAGGMSAAVAAALASDPYRVALEYLDESCRILAIRTGTALGKLTMVPTAPPTKQKVAFSSPRSASGSRRT